MNKGIAQTVEGDEGNFMFGEAVKIKIEDIKEEGDGRSLDVQEQKGIAMLNTHTENQNT